jgi:hypothetical protein
MAVDGLPNFDAQGFDPLGVAAAANTDQYVLENGLPSSPDSLYLDNDPVAGDANSHFEAEFEMHKYINDPSGDGDSAEFGMAIPDGGNDFWYLDQGDQPKGETSSQDTFQQPDAGASPVGCDARGFAVNV